MLVLVVVLVTVVDVVAPRSRRTTGVSGGAGGGLSLTALRWGDVKCCSVRHPSAMSRGVRRRGVTGLSTRRRSTARCRKGVGRRSVTGLSTQRRGVLCRNMDSMDSVNSMNRCTVDWVSRSRSSGRSLYPPVSASRRYNFSPRGCLLRGGIVAQEVGVDLSGEVGVGGDRRRVEVVEAGIATDRLVLARALAATRPVAADLVVWREA